MDYLPESLRNAMINQLLSTTSIPHLKALIQLLDEEPYPHQYVCEWVERNIPNSGKIFGWVDSSINPGKVGK